MVAITSSGASSSYLAYLLQQASSSNNSTSTSTTKGSSPMSASDMFDKLSNEVGGDGKTVTKAQLEDYISTLESNSSSSSDKKALGFLKQLEENWDNISNGSDSITKSDLEKGMSYLAPPSNSLSSGTSNDLYESLLDAMGVSSSNGITEDDLFSYLKNLTSDESSSSASSSDGSTKTSSDISSSTNSTDKAKEIKFVLSMINNFDTFADDSGNITSGSFYSALYEPQDTSSITSDQLTSPIDLRV